MSKQKATKTTTKDRLIAVQILRPYVLRVSFASGRTADVDMEPRLWGPVFEPLRDPERFAETTVDPELETVVWPSIGADLAPEIPEEAVASIPNRSG